jgi:homoserine kinase
MTTRVVVSAPATIANLGPGFDSMGLAIEWHNEITLELADETSVTVEGPGAGEIPTDPDRNLILRAVRSWERAVGMSPVAVRARLLSRTPYGRGFGSSSAAIVGGLVAARALLGGEAPILALAGELEGHLDNVAPCLLGGICVSGFAPDDTLRIDPPPGLQIVACIAPARLSTKAARGALPAQVPFADAVFNASRAALLAASLAAGDLERLGEATEDRLHQDHRFALAPDAGALAKGLRAQGYAAFLSGAGPSISVLAPSRSAVEVRLRASSLAPDGWDISIVDIEGAGAFVVSEA